MPCSEKDITNLVAILFIIHQTKHAVDLGKEFDESNPYMKCGRNLMINDYKCKATGGRQLGGQFGYRLSEKKHIQTWVSNL